LRRALFSLIHDPQEADLRVFNTQVAETRRYVEEHVDQAYSRDSSHCPIPIISFWGGEDNVVTSASAQASFGKTLEIEGHHSSVLQPKDASDDRYKLITGTLVQPWGHRHIFEIDRYQTVIAVAPLANPQYIAILDGQPVTRTADNVATITRNVSFSAKNLCTDVRNRDLLLLRSGSGCGRRIADPVRQWDLLTQASVGQASQIRAERLKYLRQRRAGRR
jgi:hypothetical protein